MYTLCKLRTYIPYSYVCTSYTMWPNKGLTNHMEPSQDLRCNSTYVWDMAMSNSREGLFAEAKYTV